MLADGTAAPVPVGCAYVTVETYLEVRHGRLWEGQTHTHSLAVAYAHMHAPVVGHRAERAEACFWIYESPVCVHLHLRLFLFLLTTTHKQEGGRGDATRVHSPSLHAGARSSEGG